MKVNEIFTSIDGEGIRTGYPVIFIRLFGCTLRCTYCDSMYACVGDDYKEMTVEDIILAVNEEREKYDISKITLTGGEPLMHYPEVYDLINALTDNEYEVNIETNGNVSLEELEQRATDRDNIIVTMDWKSVSSGMSDYMLPHNLDLLKEQDVLKFVVGTDEDLNQMEDVITQYPELKCSKFASPIFGQIPPCQIVKFILDHKLSDVRMQLQIHKYIYDPNARGV